MKVSRFRSNVLTKPGVTLLIGALVATMLAVLSQSERAVAATQAEFYVATTGNDTNAGTLSAPFKTLQRARDAVRGINSSMSGDIDVYVRGGTYALASTLQLTDLDSGTNGFHVTWAAYPGESVTVSGGSAVTGWATDPTDSRRIVANFSRADKLRALYVNGVPASMTSRQTQGLGGTGTYAVTAGSAPWAWTSGARADGTKVSASVLPATSRNPQNIELMSQTTWNQAIVSAASLVDMGGGNTNVRLQQPYGAIAQSVGWAPYNNGAMQTISNVFEWLDQPGQFYFDQAASKLYYFPRTGETLSNISVVAPALTTLVDVQGASTTARATNITFDSLLFEAADWNLMTIGGSHGFAGVQGAGAQVAYSGNNHHVDMYRGTDILPAAIHVTNATGLSFTNNVIRNVGASGLSLENDVSNVTLTGNTFNNTGGSSIEIGHPQGIYENDPASYQSGQGAPNTREKFPSGTEAVPRNIVIRNNQILNSSRFFLGNPAVSAFFVNGLTFEHNRVVNAPYQGIQLGWGWWNFNGDSDANLPNIPTTTAVNNTIRYNEFINTMQVLHDGGAIYTLGEQSNTLISENYVTGIPAGHVYGLHPDEGSAQITFDKNLVVVDPNAMWVVECGTWGRQNSLTITNTYTNVNKLDNPNIPNSTVQALQVFGDQVWPADVAAIAANSGPTAAYRARFAATNASNADVALPVSVGVASGAPVTVREAANSTNTFWLAPAGTSSFVSGPTMTSAAATATSINAPSQAGEYVLYVVSNGGVVGAPSTHKVVVASAAWVTVDSVSSAVTYSAGWSSWGDSADIGGSEQYTSTAGNSAELTFNGSSVRYIGMKQSNMGLVDVFLDGVKVLDGFDAYAPSTTKQFTVFQRDGLASGSHTIRVVCRGANGAGSGSICALDAFQYAT